MPCPYNIILGRDTALPSPLYHSGATGIDIILKDDDPQEFSQLSPHQFWQLI